MMNPKALNPQGCPAARPVIFFFRKPVLIRILSALSVVAAVFAQDARAQAPTLSNRGTDFWVGYGHHQFMEPGQTNAQEMVLYLSAEQAATVTVTLVTGSATPRVYTYNVPANTTITTDLIAKSGAYDMRLYSPPVSLGGNGGEGIFNRSVHIESNVPIVAYAHIYGSASSGAALLLPTNAWGYSYTSVNSAQSYAANCFSWVYVVAREDSTMVEITPSVATRLGKPAGVPFTVTLSKGQVYQVLGAPESASAKSQMTGTRVRSVVNSLGVSQPIAVFSGSSRTSGEMLCGGSGGGDNDMQQAFPAHAWGTRYLTAPFSTSTAASTFQTNVYKVITRWPNTVVRRNGVVLTPGVDGYYIFASNQPELIEADKPVMVGQFMGGGSCVGSLGDPEMVFLTALDQGITSARFFRNTREGISINYATVIVPDAALASLRIDGGSAFNHVYDHPRLAGYKIVVKSWTAAQASVQIQCDSAFTAITYGLGSVESYGYNVGLLVRNLDAWPTARIQGSAEGTDTVQAGAPFRFVVRSPHRLTGITWQLSGVSGLSPSADATLTNPAAVDSVQINGRMWYTYQTASTYTASVTGSYSVPVRYAFPLLEQSDGQATVAYNFSVAGVATAASNLVADASELTVGPNPVRGALQIRYKGRPGGLLTATLLNSMGRPAGRSHTLSGNTATMDVSGLPAGVYTLLLTDSRSGRTLQRQVVKL
ncbi:T9SS type A sorting domain-containing protein [Flaviaesturariibacter flavus]|uniref:T9SS type A sorting domain-containing protein n=1 Tax=Flaviaesturariibacter flavus TaxID=2502780 RepID=A0A4R1BB75_9BACT|nr:T9SS type A sorting domain-containing protein [Flaviaesturariibacter flavus]TCJ14245.1 T9SS type A sorting domain-containing protein [Flaviaesturariibacter flavus]